MDGSDETRPRPGGTGRAVRWLLVAPFIAMLAVPLYNRIDPRLAGVPFFYWYQMLWILIAAAIIFLVYRIERAGKTP